MAALHVLFRQLQGKPQGIHCSSAHDAVATVYVGMRLNGFGKKLVDLIALLAGVQVFVIVLGEVFHIDRHAARAWFEVAVLV